jgi:hypothetical protein
VFELIATTQQAWSLETKLPKLPLGDAYTDSHSVWFDSDYDPDLTPRLQTLIRDVSNFKESNEKAIDHLLGKVYDAAWDAVDAGGAATVSFDAASASTVGTGKEAQRPDTRLPYKGIDVIRGESKTDAKELQKAVKELRVKMKPWSAFFYGDLPSILGIAAAGNQFALKELERNGTDKDLFDGSLNLEGDMIRLLCVVIRILAYTKIRFVREEWGRAFQTRSHVAILQVGKDPPQLVKMYESPKPLLVTFYSECASVDGLEKMINYQGSSFSLMPVGCTCFPRRTEVVAAMKDIAKTVSDIHNLGWVHRDLRWSNVVLEVNGKCRRWTIIDSEFAARVNTDWTSSSLPRGGFKLKDPQQGSLVSKHLDYFLLGKMIENSKTNDDDLAAIGCRLIHSDAETREAAFKELLA